MMKPTLTVAAILAASPTLAHADIVNGSFETSYEGWTVAKDSVSGTFATAAIVGAGDSIAYGAQLYDYVDGAMVSNYSAGLPLVPRPTDGAAEALLLQNGPSVTRLSQVVTVPADRPELTFDLGYHNWDNAFSPDQSLQVQIRDAENGALLASVFEASGQLDAPMTHHAIDLADFAGMDVRVQLELVAQNNFFDVQLDHVDVQTHSSSPALPETTVAVDDRKADEAATADLAVGGCSTGKGGTSLLAALALVGVRRRKRCR